jgi:primary-amine oxidase
MLSAFTKKMTVFSGNILTTALTAVPRLFVVVALLSAWFALSQIMVRSQTSDRFILLTILICVEYVWNYYFYQDGSIEFEIRLTGILQVYVAADGEPSPYGVHVAPNINAQNHQHIFSVRVDPMVDGLQNSVVESVILPLDAPAGSPENFAGNAFFVKETVLKTEEARPYDLQKERRWKIVNPARKHYASGKDVGYVVGMKGGATPLMARSDGWAVKRAAFVTNAMWAVKDVEGAKGGRMWPAGKYVPQTREEPEDSVTTWVKGKKNIENEDIVLFFTVGGSNFWIYLMMLF